MQALGIGAAAVLGYSGNKYVNCVQQEGAQAQNGARGPTFLTMANPEGGVGLSHLLFAGALGAGAVMVLGGLQWFRREDTAKRLKPQIENLEKSALKQVRKADENSATRDQRLDQNNKVRLNKMSSDIRGEARANFDILSQQIHCVTQIALQTLSSCSKNSNTPGGEEDEECERQREKLMEWTRKAQGQADKIVDPNNVSDARRYHVSTLRAEIPGLATTPGGEEAKEDVPISTGPHVLEYSRPKKKETKNNYWSVGMSCLGCTALLGSVYMFSSADTEPAP